MGMATNGTRSSNCRQIDHPKPSPIRLSTRDLGGHDAIGKACGCEGHIAVDDGWALIAEFEFSAARHNAGIKSADRAPMSRRRNRERRRAHKGRPCRRRVPLVGATPIAGPNLADRALLRGLPACPSWMPGTRALVLAAAVAEPAHQCPVLGIEVHGSFGGSGAPFCSNSIDCLSGERTNAIMPSRGGRLIVTPAFIRFSQVA
jgi:hypothetical protein